MPAVTIHGPSIATTTPATEPCHAACEDRSGSEWIGVGRSGAEWGVRSSGRTSWDTFVSVHSP